MIKINDKGEKMFSVTLPNGNVVKVKFQHFTTDPEDLKKRRFTTRCIFRVFNGGNYLFQAFGYAKCNPSDRLNKNVGKRAALENTLYCLKDGIREVFKDISNYINKEERKLIWDEFFKNFDILR